MRRSNGALIFATIVENAKKRAYALLIFDAFVLPKFHRVWLMASERAKK